MSIFDHNPIPMSLPRSELIAKLRVDPLLWGPRHAEVIPWLDKHYDPATMPQLMLITRAGKGGIEADGIWLLGWKHDLTSWPSLLYLIFGDAYADRVMELNEKDIAAQERLAEEGQAEYGETPDRKES